MILQKTKTAKNFLAVQLSPMNYMNQKRRPHPKLKLSDDLRLPAIRFLLSSLPLAIIQETQQPQREAQYPEAVRGWFNSGSFFSFFFARF